MHILFNIKKLILILIRTFSLVIPAKAGIQLNKGIKTKILLIIIIASVLRLWQIGQVPASLDWDEASLGYNAYSILQTGKDEYGKVLPVVLESFGDYKPALYAYLIIPFLNIFGLTEIAVRLPAALIGIIAVLLTYFLTKELLKRTDIALTAS